QRYEIEPTDSIDRKINRLKKAIKAEIAEHRKSPHYLGPTFKKVVKLEGQKITIADGIGAWLDINLKKVEEARRLGGFSREIYNTPKLTQEQIFESLKRIRADIIEGGVYNKMHNMLPKPYGPRVAHIRVPEPIRIDLKRAMGKETERKAYEAELMQQ